MTPKRRDFKFDLPADRIHDWHGRGGHVSHFFNALSTVFPVGERFFINSVRAYRNQISGSGIDQEIVGFIGQEAMHGREHELYNRLLSLRGLPEAQLEAYVAGILRAVQKMTPRSWQLSVTLALEHFTAILADHLLKNPEMLKGSEPAFRNIWRWHALEETEHKAVAFDVWNSVMGRSPTAYIVRSVGMLMASAAFVCVIAVFTMRLIEADPATRRNPIGYRQLWVFLMDKPGMLRTGFPMWVEYFRTSFHPWQHNNRHLLSIIDEISSEMRKDSALSKAA